MVVNDALYYYFQPLTAYWVCQYNKQPSEKFQWQWVFFKFVKAVIAFVSNSTMAAYQTVFTAITSVMPV